MNRSSLQRRLVLLVVLVSGCATLPTQIESRSSPCAARGIVLVIDGAGGYQTAPRSIAMVTNQMDLPLYVRSFEWTHGKNRILADALDLSYARCKGQLLAEEVCRYRAAYPGVPIYLVGFSAGSMVTLTAAELLPYDSLERIVLLAPSVSANYDLRRALASSRQGLDVFISEQDRLILGLGTAVIGNSDGVRAPAAGRVGFRPPALCPDEAWLTNRLHQHPIDCSAAWTGNDGSHAGSLHPAYLKAYVLPLLTTTGTFLPSGG